MNTPISNYEKRFIWQIKTENPKISYVIIDVRNFMSLLELPSTRHKRKLATHQQNHRWQQKPTIRVHTLNPDFSTQVPYGPSLTELPETHQKTRQKTHQSEISRPRLTLFPLCRP